VLPADRLTTAFRIVHGINFGSIARIDGIAANFAHGREQPALWRKDIADNREISDLPVMREFGIHGIERHLNGCGLDLPGHKHAEIPAPISDHHDLLRRRKEAGDFFLDRFGRNVYARNSR